MEDNKNNNLEVGTQSNTPNTNQGAIPVQKTPIVENITPVQEVQQINQVQTPIVESTQTVQEVQQINQVQTNQNESSTTESEMYAKTPDPEILNSQVGKVQIEEPKIKKQKQKKSSKKGLIIFILVLLLAGSGATYWYLNQKENTPIPNNELLLNISKVLNENEEDDFKGTLNVNGNQLLIVDDNKNYMYSYNNNTFTTTFTDTDEDAFKIFYILLDTISVNNGNEVGDIPLYDDNYPILDNRLEGVKFTQVDNLYQVSINNIKFDLSKLNELVFDKNYYATNKTKLLNQTNYTDTLVKTSITTLKEENGITFKICQKNKLNNKIYQSVLELIEILYPTELQTFNKNFKDLESIEFDRFNITVVKEQITTEDNEVIDPYISIKIKNLEETPELDQGEE